MSARDLITAKKKKGESYTTLERIIMAWYVKHPVDADEAAAELDTLRAKLRVAEMELKKIATGNNCDNDGRGCNNEDIAADYFAALKGRSE